MTSAERDLVRALEARADRGLARGADAVLAGARSAPPQDLGAADRTRGGRHLLAAAAVVLVVIGAGLALASRPDDRARAGVERWCDALAAPGTGDLFGEDDVIAYLPPGSSAAALGAVAAGLRADDRVEQVQIVDRQTTYERFRKLFADSPVLLDNVRPSDLPPSVSIELADPQDAPALAAALRRRSDLYEVRQGLGDVRVLDLLVWPGTDPPWGPTSDPGLTGAAYGPDWAERADGARRHAPAAVADDVQVLLDAIEHRPDGDDDPERPSRAEAGAAAATVQAEARDRCALEVAPPFAGR